MRARWCNDAEGPRTGGPGRATVLVVLLASLPGAAHAALGGGAVEGLRLAYIDPGSGSMLLSALAAAAATVFVALKMSFHRIKSLFTRGSRKRQEAPIDSPKPSGGDSAAE